MKIKTIDDLILCVKENIERFREKKDHAWSTNNQNFIYLFIGAEEAALEFLGQCKELMKNMLIEQKIKAQEVSDGD